MKAEEYLGELMSEERIMEDPWGVDAEGFSEELGGLVEEGKPELVEARA